MSTDENTQEHAVEALEELITIPSIQVSSGTFIRLLESKYYKLMHAVNIIGIPEYFLHPNPCIYQFKKVFKVYRTVYQSETAFLCSFNYAMMVAHLPDLLIITCNHFDPILYCKFVDTMEMILSLIVMIFFYKYGM